MRRYDRILYQLERDEEELENELNSGRITPEEYRKQLRELHDFFKEEIEEIESEWR